MNYYEGSTVSTSGYRNKDDIYPLEAVGEEAKRSDGKRLSQQEARSNP